MGGKVKFNMAPTRRHPMQPLCSKLWSHGRSSLQQEVHPQPGKAAKGNFEAARPIDSSGIRILLLPVLPLINQFAGKSEIISEPIGLGECYQMLMAIQLPRDLCIPYRGEI